MPPNNIVIASDRQQNIVLRYRLSKITDNMKNFHVKKECHECVINHDDVDYQFNLWTSVPREKNNTYIVILSEENNSDFGVAIQKWVDDLVEFDPQYHCLLLINALKTQTKNSISPYACACSSKCFSIAINMSVDEHIFDVFNILKYMIFREIGSNANNCLEDEGDIDEELQNNSPELYV
jgi:hypothetical protein